MPGRGRKRCVISLLGLLACHGSAPTSDPSRLETAPASDSRGAVPAVMSLRGRPLTAVELPPEVQAEREHALAEAERAYAAAPTLDHLIWVGRRLAYLGRHAEAIEWYSRGLEQQPDEPRLLRHRGHRYITTRQFARAEVDLARAAALLTNTADEVEIDGLPNPAGVPTSTLHTNVHYHLGLARFLLGDFEGARTAYEACMQASTTDDMAVATAHWMYMTLRRLGRDEEAARLVARFDPSLRLYENFSYLRLLSMYRGEVPPDALVPAEASDVDRATLGFGLGHWHYVAGDPARAAAVWSAVVDTPQWASFGYIAAEAELVRVAP